ncbi:MAG TPA: protein kinase [Pirellulales bacterium]|nr:protein kinase [Pirellulales bacterium]
MADLLSSITKQCPDVPSSLVETHVRRMPDSYLEGYAPAEIARHVKLLARLAPEQQVEVDARSIGGQNYEICVVGFDRTGVLAALTTALASDGLDTQDLRIATYAPDEEGAVDSARFVDVARVTANRKGVSVTELAGQLRDRLTIAFRHLAEGDLLSAQTAAADSRSTSGSGSRPARVPAAPWVVKEGLVLGDFRLESKLATGGMSEVYLATQLSLHRKAAIKIISCPAGKLSDSSVTRFQKEATVLASFTSPHIVQVLASGTTPAANGTMLRWLAMEYVPGGDLATWVKEHGPLGTELALHWLLQALQGLQYAHARGIVHRDVKPHNLLLTADNDVKISDFGLLKDAHESMELTMQGGVMGTPQYISPEQAMAEDVDERSDIYSLGATFFHMLTGRLAFEERTTTAQLLKVTQQRAPSLLDVAPGVARSLAIIVDRMLALRPEDRYQDVRVVLEDLKSYMQRGLLQITDEGLADKCAGDEGLPQRTQMYMATVQTRAPRRMDG